MKYGRIFRAIALSFINVGGVFLFHHPATTAETEKGKAIHE